MWGCSKMHHHDQLLNTIFVIFGHSERVQLVIDNHIRQVEEGREIKEFNLVNVSLNQKIK